MECYVSINEYSDCYMHIRTNNKDLDTNFEMPYDIAENLCYFLSNFGHVELWDEEENKIILENNKQIKKGIHALF